MRRSGAGRPAYLQRTRRSVGGYARRGVLFGRRDTLARKNKRLEKSDPPSTACGWGIFIFGIQAAGLISGGLLCTIKGKRGGSTYGSSGQSPRGGDPDISYKFGERRGLRAPPPEQLCDIFYRVVGGLRHYKKDREIIKRPPVGRCILSKSLCMHRLF